MQTANIMLAIGGDAGTTVPKYDVTPSEVAVLRMIHGDSAVFDIEPTCKLTGDDKRTDREEIARLAALYGSAKISTPTGEVPVMTHLFPGGGARAYQDFDDLDIPEEFYKPTERAKPSKAEDDADKKTAKSKKADKEDAKKDEPKGESENGENLFV